MTRPRDSAHGHANHSSDDPFGFDHALRSLAEDVVNYEDESSPFVQALKLMRHSPNPNKAQLFSVAKEVKMSRSTLLSLFETIKESDSNEQSVPGTRAFADQQFWRLVQVNHQTCEILSVPQGLLEAAALVRRMFDAVSRRNEVRLASFPVELEHDLLGFDPDRDPPELAEVDLTDVNQNTHELLNVLLGHQLDSAAEGLSVI